MTKKMGVWVGEASNQPQESQELSSVGVQEAGF